MPKVFVDTNVLVYTLDQHDAQKQHHCRTVLRQLQSRGEAVVSTQVLQEFHVDTSKVRGDAQFARVVFPGYFRYETK